MKLTRREVFARGSMVLSGAAAIQGRAFAQSAEPEYVETKTIYGRVRGAKTGNLTTFKGIPYAGSASGANRFKAAAPLKPWTDVRGALQFGAPSPQPGQRRGEPPQDENCQFLNVWTPAADGRRRPVMFYSHGGGFTTGSAASGYQDGGNLARAYGVVVVATNHRLGIAGYLYLGELGGEEYATSGNQGLEDIRDGLKWVHDNIEVFGGDPGNVMIFGESGGGSKTSCLYAMPSAAPYFHKASIESGPGIRMMPRDSAAETTLMVLKHLGIEKSDWRKLLEVSTDKLLEAQTGLGSSGGGPLGMNGGRKGMGGGSRPGGFGPVVDGAILPHHPFEPEAPAISKNKPLMVGYNHDETVFFFQQQRNIEVFTLTEESLKARLAKEFSGNADAIYEAYHKSRPAAAPSQLYVAITTARMIGIGAVTIAERKYAQHGAPAFAYIFTHASDAVVPGTQFKQGSPHAMEIRYKFNNVQPAGTQQGSPPPSQQGANGAPGGRGGGRGASPEDVKAGHNMAELWSTFARTGHPAAHGQPEWPPYTTEKRATMQIDSQCEVVNDPNPLERQLWARLDP
ncbi:Carboxylesterase [Candidatus Sulfopaludibacter sp. SbA3]|nr:Carboxylesterase [Candidatus Sulfopaludibacter sp. SbA3]